MLKQLTKARFFKKLSKKQALNKVSERVYKLIKSDRWTEDVFINKVHSLIKFPKDVEKIYDIIYYTAISIESESAEGKININKLSSLLEERLSKVSMNLEGYFTAKYQLDSILVTLVANPDALIIDMEARGYMSVIYTMNCLIDICMFRADKRIIRGVDLETNKLKYTGANMIFDLVALTFKNELDIDFYQDALKATCINYVNYTGDKDIDIDAMMSINDKVDDTLRLHYDSCILVDILNQKSNANIQLAKPSRKIIEYILYSGKVTYIPNDIFRKRNCLTSTNGNLLVSKNQHEKDEQRVSSVLVKDVMLSNCPFIAVSYKTSSNLEDTVLIPLHFNAIVQTIVVEAIDYAFKFYGIDYFNNTEKDFEVMSPYYWKYRNRGYVSTGDRINKFGKLEREYKEIEIGIHKAKLGNPSDKAIKLAKKYCIELESGETIVDTHIRHYGKKKELVEAEVK